jgi:myo-inositol-1(or 4)-monophosphatase
VIVDVFRSETFSAVRGRGAWRNGHPLEVSKTPLERSLAATGFPYDRHEHAGRYAEVLAAVLAKTEGVRRMGTASLDLAWVAAGRYDRFWELKLAPWDVAAGLLIVAEAGGVATDRRGTASRPEDDHFIVSNGVDHEPFRVLLDEAFGDLVP